MCVLIDREQVAANNLSHPPKPQGSSSQWTCAPLRLHRVLTINQVLGVLHAERKISDSVFASVTSFLKANAQTTASTTNQTQSSAASAASASPSASSSSTDLKSKPTAPKSQSSSSSSSSASTANPALLVPTAHFQRSTATASATTKPPQRLSLAARSPHLTHALSRRIVQIMLQKKTNLCVSAGNKALCVAVLALHRHRAALDLLHGVCCYVLLYVCWCMQM